MTDMIHDKSKQIEEEVSEDAANENHKVLVKTLQKETVELVKKEIPQSFPYNSCGKKGWKRKFGDKPHRKGRNIKLRII